LRPGIRAVVGRWARPAWRFARVAAAGFVVVAAVVLVPRWLAELDVPGRLPDGDRAKAVDSTRGRLLQIGAGLLADGALYYTHRNHEISRQTLESTRDSFERSHQLTEQGQVTDRYTKAIEQLGADNLDVRLGGIYALERIARDSAADHPTVVEVLAAFILMVAVSLHVDALGGSALWRSLGVAVGRFACAPPSS
jgi:hypothetical protein